METTDGKCFTVDVGFVGDPTCPVLKFADFYVPIKNAAEFRDMLIDSTKVKETWLVFGNIQFRRSSGRTVFDIPLFGSKEKISFELDECNLKSLLTELKLVAAPTPRDIIRSIHMCD